MDWKKSRFYKNVLPIFLCVFFSFLQSAQAEIQLNPEQWDKLKRGMEYNEKAPQTVENSPTPPPAGIGIWLKMLRIFIFGTLMVGLGFLVVRVILNSAKSSLLPKNKDKQRREIETPEEEMTINQWWQKFKTAKNNDDFRECIRILYQITLLKLAENEWITPQSEKTNMEYVSEIKKGEVAQAFTRLTHIHEYSWYGNSTIRAAEYSNFEPQFINFIHNPAIEKK